MSELTRSVQELVSLAVKPPKGDRSPIEGPVSAHKKQGKRGWFILNKSGQWFARLDTESEARYVAACINRAPLLERAAKLLETDCECVDVMFDDPPCGLDCCDICAAKKWTDDYNAATAQTEKEQPRER